MPAAKQVSGYRGQGRDGGTVWSGEACSQCHNALPTDRDDVIGQDG